MQKKMSSSGRKASKRAVCIGINDYPYDGNDLNGCVNDARAWASLLVKDFGFAKTDVKLLLDREATKKNIINALKDLLAGAQADDHLVFTNSSHGSYVADKDRDEEKYDEILCPYDIEDNHILDDELRKLIGTLKANARLTVVLDNCFSGTATRAPLSEIIPGMKPPDERRVRFLSPALRGMRVLENPWRATPRSRIKLPESKMKEIVLTGCTDKEYSYDARINGKFHGAMTYYALEVIRQAAFKLTYSQLHQRLLKRITDYPQHPQLEGKSLNKKRLLFS